MNVLTKLISQVAACTLLPDSLKTFTEGLAQIVENGVDPKELAAALRYIPPDDHFPEIGVAAALTINTSHISVYRYDELVPVLRTALESGDIYDRKAHIASIEMALDPKRIEIAAQVVALREALDAKTAEHADVVSQLEATSAALEAETADRAAVAAKLDEALTVIAVVDKANSK